MAPGPKPDIANDGVGGVYNTFYTQRHLIGRPTLRKFRPGAEAAWVAATMRYGWVGLVGT